MIFLFIFSKSRDLWNHMVLGPDQELPRQQIPEFTLNVMNQNLWSVETRNLFLKISSDSEDYISLRTTEVDETTQCVGMGGSEGYKWDRYGDLCKLLHTSNGRHC